MPTAIVDGQQTDHQDIRQTNGLHGDKQLRELLSDSAGKIEKVVKKERFETH